MKIHLKQMGNTERDGKLQHELPLALRILGMSGLGCQVTTCFEASLGGSGVSIGGG